MKIPLPKKYRRNVTRYLRSNPTCPVSAAIAYALAVNRKLGHLPLKGAAQSPRGYALLVAITVVTKLPRPRYLTA